MKKIVALVLSLVMVLGLATTAFAANVPQWVTNNATAGFDVFDGNNVKANVSPVMVKYNAAKAPTAANGYVGNIAFYTLDLADTEASITLADGTAIVGENTWFVLVSTWEKGCVALKAHNPLLATGANWNSVASQSAPTAVYFLKPVAAVSYNWTAEKYNAFGTKCGDVKAPYFVANLTETQAVVRDTKNFVKDATFGTQAWDQLVLLDTGYEQGSAYGTWANYLVDGVIYTAADYDDVETVKHTWVASKYDEKTSLPTEYTCSVCKTVGTVVASPFLAPADAEIEQLDNLTYVYFYVGKTAAGSTVESAQTFDAGIAMYVGMSVMAAAGSAVVLKKKD